MFQSLAEIAMLRATTPKDAARCYQTKIASQDGHAEDQAYLEAFESRLFKTANDDDMIIPLGGIGQFIGTELVAGMMNASNAKGQV